MPRAVHTKIDLTSIEYRTRPFEAFERLRQRGPMVPSRLTLLGKMWLVTTYQAVSEVLKSDRLFCRNPKNAGKRDFHCSE